MGTETVGTDTGNADTLVVAPPDHVAIGTIIGRYIVERELGRGGMGIVLAARDPDLQRTVAVKLVRHRGTLSATARQRLLREGRAIAQLAHPNVVSMFEIGLHDDELFIAMEYVPGSSLAAWRRGRRAQRDILDVFVQAGRGLHAAHQAGIVHRDFKPENVHVGEDGRVRVLDFGLARTDGEATTPDDPGELTTTITATGSIMGTPAYMAPEQFEGREADARADQFAFCVALYEALCGERPFAGATFAELRDTVLAGRRRAIPRAARVPRAIVRLLERGLATEPARRFASLGEIVERLERVRGRRRWLAVAVVLPVAAAITIAVVARRGEPTESAPRDTVVSKIVRESGANLYPSLSPDARQIVYSNQTDILLRAIGSDDVVNLTGELAAPATQPELSPDGTRVAFSAGGMIHVVGVRGDLIEQVTPGFWPTWAPDGRELAYVTHDLHDLFTRGATNRGASELWRIELTTKRRQKLVDDALQPDWSPDGARIAFVTGSHVATVRADGQELRKSDLKTSWFPVWAADSRAIYAVRERHGRYESG